MEEPPSGDGTNWMKPRRTSSARIAILVSIPLSRVNYLFIAHAGLIATVSRTAVAVSCLGEDLTQDRSKCELRVLGKRHVAVDVQALCDRLDLMVGPKVAEVILNQHEFHLGKQDAAEIRAQKPHASVREIVGLLTDAECVSGVGTVGLAIPENPPYRVKLEIANPCVRRTVGASKAFLSSYWCGVLTSLLGKEFKAEGVVYDEARDLLKCELVAR